ncbi:MAG: hydroxyisourate hydrolase [Thermoleophilaceae bacterium]
MSTTGQLTTHVLDTARGRPAAGVAIELLRHTPGAAAPEALTRARTNSDGRTDRPLLAAGELRVGRYELVFDVGAYFDEQGVVEGDQPFLELVPVRFGVADAGASYHVPLLVSPWAYSTYRGS